MKPLRIAVVSYGLPVPGQKRGGIERVAHDLADGLARRGHQVCVWSHDPAPGGAAYSVRALPGRRLAQHWLGRRLTFGLLGNFLALAPSYRGYDVILAHGDSLLLPLLGKPVARVMHGSALFEALSATSVPRFLLQSGVYAQELLTAFTQRGCVAVSHNARRHNPFVRRVIPNGIDTSAFYPDGAVKTSDPSILFVGALTGRKRGAHLLEWFSQVVRPRHPHAMLWMVSSPGPELPGVSYYTGIGLTDLAAMYRGAWVYASPSTYEGFGLPYVEAMASGTPVIATPNAGSREVLDGGRFGILASDADFPSRLAALLDDSAERAKLAAAGLERAQAYSLTASVDRFERFLEELCTRGR